MGNPFVTDAAAGFRRDDAAFGIAWPEAPHRDLGTGSRVPRVFVMKRVLVTGASGFIGRRVLGPLLDLGYEVHGVSYGRTTSGRLVTVHAANLLDRGAREALIDSVRPTHLLHLAWYAETGAFWTSPLNLSWTAATLELTKYFRERGGERAAIAGTCAEYDWTHGWCSEISTPCAPATLYGAAKDATRRVTLAYGTATGLEVAWGRIFNLYGPDEDPGRLVTSVTRSLLLGQEARTSHGEQIRDFSHVEDVARALVSLLDSEVIGAVNIASGEPVRIRTVVEILGALTGASHLLRIGALPAPTNDPPLLVADVRRLRDEIGFSPSYRLESGLAAAVEALRAVGAT